MKDIQNTRNVCRFQFFFLHHLYINSEIKFIYAPLQNINNQIAQVYVFMENLQNMQKWYKKNPKKII